VAQLIDTFHYTPGEVAQMTWAQIDALCFHPRNKDGSLRRPGPPAQHPGPPEARGGMPYVPPPAGPEEALARLAAYCKELGMGPGEVEAAVLKHRKKWGTLPPPAQAGPRE
jgi:hypothetical protein